MYAKGAWLDVALLTVVIDVAEVRVLDVVGDCVDESELVAEVRVLDVVGDCVDESELVEATSRAPEEYVA